jgi:hypothetical protein
LAERPFRLGEAHRLPKKVRVFIGARGASQGRDERKCEAQTPLGRATDASTRWLLRMRPSSSARCHRALACARMDEVIEGKQLAPINDLM